MRIQAPVGLLAHRPPSTYLESTPPPEPVPEPVAQADSGANQAAPATREALAPAAETIPAAAAEGGRDGGPAGGTLSRYRWPTIAGVVLIVAAAAIVIALGSGGSSKPQGQPFGAAAQPVPTNHVTGSGAATVRLNGDVASVTVDSTGLLNGSPHAMQIHAGGRGVCPPASAAHLHNGHLAINTTDGIKFYGPPQVSLTSTGDTSAKSIIDFARYPTVERSDTRATSRFPWDRRGDPRRQRGDHRARDRLQPQRDL